MQPDDPRFTARVGEPPWPGWVREFRDHQITAVESIVDAFARGVDVVFLDAPVGSGKTLVAEMVRKIMGVRGVYICSGKDLQDQFLRDFDYSRVLKGRSNYPTLERADLTAEDCTGQGCAWCPSRVDCPYQIAKRQAAGAPVSVLNTAYFLAETQGERSLFSGRELVVVDESDTLESMLMNHVEFRVSERRLGQLGIDPPVKSARAKTIKSWLEDDLIPALKMRRDKLGAQGDLFGTGPSVETMREKNRINQTIGRARTVAAGLVDDTGEIAWGDWVRDYDYRHEGDVILKPVTVSQVGAASFWPHGQRWLCMSGSIISAEEQAESLGVDDAGLSWEMVTVPMTFPKENRPIVYRPAANMTYRTQADEYPKLVNAVEKVLDDHPEDNVLIHAVNYNLTRDLARDLALGSHGGWAGSRQVYSYDSGRDRAWALEQFKRTGGVLVAPSMDRGVDLPDDLCRVVIIAKVPFPSLKDRQIEQRMSRPGGQGWYAIQVARTVLQMTGRGVRSAEDSATTYILDVQFGAWWGKSGRRLMPAYWKEALRG